MYWEGLSRGLRRAAERRRRLRRRLRIGLCWLLGPLALSLLLGAGDSSVVLARQRALQAIVIRDAAVTATSLVPPGMADYLSAYDVIAVGEGRHQIRAYEQAIIDITLAMHPLGVRQLLLEMPHAYDREMNAYVMGERPSVSAVLMHYAGRRLQALREYNAGLPPGERIAARAIDMNPEPWLYTHVLNQLAEALTQVGADVAPLAPVLGRYSDGTSLANVRAVYRALLTDADALRVSWGAVLYDQILEMTWVQWQSLLIGAGGEEADVAARAAREDLIKELVERRLSEAGDTKTVLHLGAHHVQRHYLKGAEIAWLGAYLDAESPAASQRTFLLLMTAAKGCYLYDGRPVRFDVARSGDPSELMRVLGDVARQRERAWAAAFLPLDDPHLARSRIPVNYSGIVYTHVPKEQFDGYLLLREADCGAVR